MIGGRVRMCHFLGAGKGYHNGEMFCLRTCCFVVVSHILALLESMELGVCYPRCIPKEVRPLQVNVLGVQLFCYVWDCVGGM